MDLEAADYVIVSDLDTGVTHIALYTREGMADTLMRKIFAADRSQPGFEPGFKVDDVAAQ